MRTENDRKQSEILSPLRDILENLREDKHRKKRSSLLKIDSLKNTHWRDVANKSCRKLSDKKPAVEGSHVRNLNQGRDIKINLLEEEICLKLTTGQQNKIRRKQK